MRHQSPATTSAHGANRVAGSGITPSRRAPGPAPEFLAVIDAMPEPVLVCDRRDRVQVANPAADRLFAGRPVQDAGDLLSRFESVPVSKDSDGGPVTLQPRTIPNRWFELRTIPLDHGAEGDEGSEGRASLDEVGQILVLREVTAAREARAERRAFLSILSHELRTPITTIYAGSRVLARRDPARASGDQGIARDISAEAARLYDVVEDLLVLTRTEQDVLELSHEPILLQRVVEGAIRVARGRTLDMPIFATGTTDPSAVEGDAGYVEQVVRNLVTSATRFAGPNVPVVIRLAEGDAEVSLEVLDRGPDLSAAELETSFALVDGGGVRATGRGIGLFVCRRLIEAMRGRVWVRARDGGGAVFGFALPRYEPE